MISLSKISKTFAGRCLFQELSLQIQPTDRLGLVGANGVGKTTLFSLILGEDEPDSGQVQIQRGLRIGFLPQECAASGQVSLLHLATSEHIPAAGQEWQWTEEEELEMSYRQPKAKRILMGLGFKESDFEKSVSTFSGGWILRAHLARLLVVEPDLLMLDEPTNHLDLESVQWLQNFLRNYPRALLIISHDRAFLNALVTGIVELRSQRLRRYVGNYEAFLKQRMEQLEHERAAYENQQKEIAHLQSFIDRFGAKATKAAQAQSRVKQLARMERLPPPEVLPKTVEFRFPQPPRSGQRVVVLKEVHQAYGDRWVYQGLDLEIERGQRLVLVGPNGAGKSTLLKILAGRIPIQGGECLLGHQVKVGYYAQHRLEALNPRHTVLEAAQSESVPIPEERLRTLLGAFFFSGEAILKPVGVLSGGEKSRLALLKILVDPPNLLLMDEPTTHLDIPSIEALIGALRHFEGTLVFVSHDVYFINALAEQVLHVQGGQTVAYAGNYQYFLEKSKITCEREGLIAGKGGGGSKSARLTGESSHAKSLKSALSNHQPSECHQGSDAAAGREGQRQRIFKTKAEKQIENQARQAQAQQLKQDRKQLEKLEAQILELEKQQRIVVERLQCSETYKNAVVMQELNQSLQRMDAELKHLSQVWEGLIVKVTQGEG